MSQQPLGGQDNEVYPVPLEVMTRLASVSPADEELARLYPAVTDMPDFLGTILEERRDNGDA